MSKYCFSTTYRLKTFVNHKCLFSSVKMGALKGKFNKIMANVLQS